MTISEHDNLGKTRKSLYAASIYTFVISNTHLLTNKLNLFGLEVLVDQGALIIIGRLSVAFLLVLYCLHGFSMYSLRFDFRRQLSIF